MDRDVFVTREPGLADLQRRLAATQAAGGAVVLCEGEPGMGKTALAAELARRARDQSVVVAWGSCLEGAVATAYRPWTQVVGALGGGVIDLITDPAGVGNASRFRIFDDVVEALRAVSAGSGMLVVLDDLHWADVASLRLLQVVPSSQGPRSATIAQWRFAVSLMRNLAGDLPQPSTEQSTEVFEVRRIVIPRDDIVI